MPPWRSSRCARMGSRIRLGRTTCSPSARPSGCSPKTSAWPIERSAVTGGFPRVGRRSDGGRMSRTPSTTGAFRGGQQPPPNPRGDPTRWKHDSAKRVVGWKVDSPESVLEKVEAIHDLAADDAVTAVVTTDFLRRPAVASKAMADDTARHTVNEAQSLPMRATGPGISDVHPYSG
ncbi:DUF6192 family protein [Streptomyces olivochromogenes]|uniref:DUF6192 family protein n=1 Tax=Streptomyces olivochromogenes TaxID=1963 RepID=UPI0027E5A8FA|nr:DUF6192 family protein [Streptomyces olivochromogenes]